MEISEEMLAMLKSVVFVDMEEDLKAILGNSYLKELITKGGVETGIIMVTNKRTYLEGQSYVKEGKHLRSIYGKKVVDLKDVTGTSFHLEADITPFLITMFFGVIALFGFANRNVSMGIAAAIACGAVYLLHLNSKTTYLEVSFAGGSIYLNTSWYKKEEIQDFERQLRKAKDQLLEQEKQYSIQTGMHPQPLDKVTRLKQCKELLEEGAINEDEFARLKEEILSREGV